MGLPDTETIILSYQGKSFKTKLSDNVALIANKNSLSTVYKPMALPGGATTNQDAEAVTQLIDTGSEDQKTTILKQLMIFISCLSLSEDEITTLAS